MSAKGKQPKNVLTVSYHYWILS